MATVTLLRACSRGTHRLLLRPLAFSQSLPGLVKPDITSKTVMVTPAMQNAVKDYLRARRGPFTPEEKRGNHMMIASTHWKVERILAISMLGIMPACLFVQNPFMDMLLCTSVFFHYFWALDHVLTDYLEKFVPWIHKFWYVMAALGFAGLINFNLNDVGVTKAIQMLWSLH
ncbi:hypothetical protein ScPMuIL_001232 [Solemya velum]